MFPKRFCCRSSDFLILSTYLPFVISYDIEIYSANIKAGKLRLKQILTR